MSMASASPGENRAATGQAGTLPAGCRSSVAVAACPDNSWVASRPLRSMLVWDLPVRLFHWSMVACFAVAWATAESEAWRLVHVGCGWTMAGLVGFRLGWGVVGSRYARFRQFVRGPAGVLRYVRSLLARRPEHHTGHNPLGAVAIVLLLVLTALVAASGWMAQNETGGPGIGEWHEAAATLMATVVGVHVAGAVLASWQHRENLVLAMLTGRKRRHGAEPGIDGDRLPVAALLLAGMCIYWGLLLLA